VAIEAELTVAVTGVLKPTAVDGDTSAAASTLLDTFDRRLRKWVRGTEGKPFEPVKFRDLQQTRKLVQKPLPESVLQDLLKPLLVVDPAAAMDYQAVLLRARSFLDTSYPLETIDSVLGPEEMLPAPDKASRWLSVVAVIDDPERMIDEVEMGGPDPSQVAAFKACYPELHQALLSIVMSELASMLAQSMRSQASGKPALTLPYDREATVRLLGQVGFATPLDIPEPKKDAPPEATGKSLDLEKDQAPGERLSRPA
jgi:hypothetical protein